MLNCTVVTTANDTVLEQNYSGFCSRFICLGERMTEPSPSSSNLLYFVFILKCESLIIFKFNMVLVIISGSSFYRPGL